ncbi:hypothetical protein O6H91_13G004600 [Diphasiastrum complanatum]|uniref:Uncharacterized protein n=2 Tax=Diphasiastrum complanatum TaxID=34168 RepID=A0ACC2BRZ6_DIPCM|nr:hypothetical protein O6H91_13G004300 [Diphasiastrum complanatum]KAJ7532465.1 hypothetical protein O6H91_13G004600 [Diphasiastrum complanatum]
MLYWHHFPPLWRGCGVMSGAVLFIKDDLKIDESQVELLMGSIVMVSLIGGLVTGVFADAIGRRKTMLVGASVVFFGCMMMGFAPSYAVLLTGRILTGIGIGFSYVIVPLYITELSPPESRGMLSSFPEIFINSGIVLGYVSSLCLSGLPISINWRLMLVLGAMPAIVLVCSVLILPESPRWLVVKNRNEEALSVLIMTSTDSSEAEIRLQDIVLAVDVPKQWHEQSFAKLDKVEAGDASNLGLEKAVIHPQKIHGVTIWSELFWPSPQICKILFIALGLQFFQQASGVAAMIYYTPFVFAKAGLESKVGDLGATVAVGIAKTAFILVATLLLDRSGRRPLLLISNLGMTISMLTLGTSFLFVDPGLSAKQLETPNALVAPLAVGATFSFFAFFSMGYGPICALLPTEIFPLRLRARGMSLTMALNRTLSGIISLTFLSIMDVLTPAGTFFLFAGMTVLSIIFVYLFVPETKGRSLEEMS